MQSLGAEECAQFGYALEAVIGCASFGAVEADQAGIDAAEVVNVDVVVGEPFLEFDAVFPDSRSMASPSPSIFRKWTPSRSVSASALKSSFASGG